MDAKFIIKFWQRIEKGDDCWKWIGGSFTKHGYGIVWLPLQYKQALAHRIAWILTHGPIPEAMRVCHSCDNPPCCNTAHLFLGTAKDNSLDMVRKMRHSYGERQGRSKLKEADVHAIRNARKDGVPLAQIAELFSICIPHASDIVNRKKWAWLP